MEHNSAVVFTSGVVNENVCPKASCPGWKAARRLPAKTYGMALSAIVEFRVLDKAVA